VRLLAAEARYTRRRMLFSLLRRRWLRLRTRGSLNSSKADARRRQALGKLYAELAAFVGIPFFDAGVVLSTGGTDGVHFFEGEHVLSEWPGRYRSLVLRGSA